jgi:hypothetical protein
MTAPADTLPFPPGRPSDYLPLEDEPSFVAGEHLALEMPTATTDLATLGYQESDLAECASTFAVSKAFRILSTEGVAAMRHVCEQIYHNRNANEGTGANRLGSYARGAGYRSQFIRDFCDSPELAAHLSDIARIPLGRHSVPAVACGINYAPEDISRAVDTWHVDSVAFDIVMMITDPSILKGGEFQYFHGTKQEGQALLGITGEEGVDTALPEDRVVTIPFPEAGFGFMQQGTMIFHRACRLLERADRITMIPSFEVLPANAPDSTNTLNMADWDDPGICPELARHEIWRTQARLHSLLGEIALEDHPAELSARINAAIGRLVSFSDKLEKKSS